MVSGCNLRGKQHAIGSGSTAYLSYSPTRAGSTDKLLISSGGTDAYRIDVTCDGNAGQRFQTTQPGRNLTYHFALASLRCRHRLDWAALLFQSCERAAAEEAGRRYQEKSESGFAVAGALVLSLGRAVDGAGRVRL